jgi:hypothetical protein
METAPLPFSADPIAPSMAAVENERKRAATFAQRSSVI